jgi:hypothetical protein
MSSAVKIHGGSGGGLGGQVITRSVYTPTAQNTTSRVLGSLSILGQNDMIYIAYDSHACPYIVSKQFARLYHRKNLNA